MIMVLLFIGCLIWLFVSPRCVTCRYQARILARCVPGALFAAGLVILALFR